WNTGLRFCMTSQVPIWRQAIATIRGRASWIIIPAFLSLLVSHNYLINHYPLPLPYGYPTTRSFDLVLLWRNLSLLAVVLGSLFSLPRWPAWAGFAITVVFLALFGNL